jgi:hypothetical protein
VDSKLVATGFGLNVVDCHHAAQKRDHADDQEDFAAGDTGGTGVVGTAGDGTFIELDCTEENERERPPVEHFAQLQAAIIVEEEERTDG